MYDIQEKNDMSTGLQLIVNVPEEDVDKKALYTLLADLPDFVLPFSYRFVDGLCELTYQVGTCNKMIYMSGPRNADDYIEMWQGLLKPLHDCGDWFAKIFSFVLKYDHIYHDKNGKTLKYIYIPTLTDCYDYNNFRAMVMEVIRQNRVTDVFLENKILLWALQDSTPQAFFDIVAISKTTQENESSVLSVSYDESAQYPKHTEQLLPQTKPSESNLQPMSSKSGDTGLIVISQPKKPSFFSRFIKNKRIPDAGNVQETEPHSQEIHLPDDNTMPVLTDIVSDSPKLRYTGMGLYPRVIEIVMPESDNVFTIGRFDPNVGIKQANFEFDKNAKAISRRHVAIEKNGDGYYLVDLNSDDGTFINGQKLMPNTPIRLESGYLVCFGNSGAEYAWVPPTS